MRCLQGEMSFFCGSIASLQAALMILLDGKEDWLALDTVLVTAISGAQKLGLHRLGDAKLDVPVVASNNPENNSAASYEQPYVRLEVAVRIW